MDIVEIVSQRFLSELAFDRQLFAVLEGKDAGGLDVESLGKALRVGVDDVNAGLMRLRQRRLVA